MVVLFVAVFLVFTSLGWLLVSCLCYLICGCGLVFDVFDLFLCVLLF